MFYFSLCCADYSLETCCEFDCRDSVLIFGQMFQFCFFFWSYVFVSYFNDRDSDDSWLFGLSAI